MAKNQFSIRMVSMRYFDGKMILLVICALVILYTTFSNMNTLRASPSAESEGYEGSEMGRTPVEYTRRGRPGFTPMTQMRGDDMVRYSYTHPHTKHVVNGYGPGQHTRQITKEWADIIKLKVFGKGNKQISFADLLGRPRSHESKMLEKKFEILDSIGIHTMNAANINRNSVNTLDKKINATKKDVDGILGIP